jgi:PKD repeat protein
MKTARLLAVLPRCLILVLTLLFLCAVDVTISTSQPYFGGPNLVTNGSAELLRSRGKPPSSPTHAGSPSQGRYSLKGDYRGITYDRQLGMLSVSSREVFLRVVASLAAERKGFKYDHGSTTAILAALSGRTTDEALTRLLLVNSPLSDQVLLAFLASAHPPDQVKQVLLANVDFSDAVDERYQQLQLGKDVRAAIDDHRFDHVPEDPVLDAFEASLPGFSSLRKSILAAELRLLAAGGDPESRDNPANNGVFDDVVATLLAARKEIRIGRSIYLMLPGRSVQIVDGDRGVLDYVRGHGDIPRVQIPAGEPPNGFAAKLAPRPIDPNVVVQPAEQQNGCGGVGTDVEYAQGRFALSATSPNKRVRYFWDFGDGYVSYRAATDHQFRDGKTTHTVVLTPYDDQGAGCGGVVVHTSTGGPGSTSGCAASFSSSSSGTNASFYATVSGMVPLVTYQWDFGDGGFSNSGSVGISTSPFTHSYAAPGQYSVELTATDSAGCTASITNTIVVQGGSSGGAHPVCCDKRDRDRETWVEADTKHKFVHKLALHNDLFSSWIVAKVTSYKKYAGFYWWSATSGCVDMSGFIYAPIIGGGGNCATSLQLNGNECGSGIWHDTSFHPQSTIFVEYNSMGSTGSAYGNSNTAYVSDCN